jgi:hypothetical protein
VAGPYEAVRRRVADAPATFGWLLALLVTTRVQRSAGRRRSQLLRSHSTNLHHLSKRPTRVLAASLFWIDGRRWWPYVVPYVAVLAPAERRLGSARWLAVGVAAHVAGTFVGQGLLRRSIRARRSSPRLVNARDVGVSYFLLGVAGAMSAYLPDRYRPAGQAAGVAVLSVNAVVRPTFTEFGHLSAYLTGLLLTPLAPEGDPYPGRHGYADD